MIESENRLFIELVKYAFKGFIAFDKKYIIKIKIVIDESRDTNAYSYGRPHRTSVISESGKFFSRGSSYSGMFDINTLTAEVSQSLAIAPLYLFLRFVVSVYLPLRGGIVAHSSSIARGGKCFLFLGKPQSGKSTVAKLSAEYHILSDDFSIIRKTNGIFAGFGSPFWGHVEVKGRNVGNRLFSIPIEGAYFLKHDNKPYTQKLSRKEALRELVSNIAILSKDKVVNTKILQTAEEFTNQVPAYYLYFKPDNSFWRAIENDKHVCSAK